jgi:type IV pilus assembly protein PilN
MRISLNLATRPFADLGPAIKRLRIAMGVLAGVSIGLGIGLHFLHHKAELARDRDHSLDGAIARIARERQSYTDLMHLPPNAQVLDESGVLNHFFDEKTFSWTLAMEDLETVLPGGVQVSSIEPVRAKDGQITLHLRVSGPRDREVELVQNLEHSRRFLSPRIVGENAQSTGAPGQQLEPVSASNRFDFDLLAEYNSAAPVDHKPAGAASSAAKTAAPAHLPAPAAPGRLPRTAATPLRHPGRPPYTGPQRPAATPAVPQGAGGPQ